MSEWNVISLSDLLRMSSSLSLFLSHILVIQRLYIVFYCIVCMALYRLLSEVQPLPQVLTLSVRGSTVDVRI